MKLYTEKQLRQAIAQGYDWCHQKYMPSDNMIEIFIKQLTPIELPTDEEVYFESRRYEKYHESMDEVEAERSAARYHGHMQGAKWMRDKILNK